MSYRGISTQTALPFLVVPRKEDGLELARLQQLSDEVREEEFHTTVSQPTNY